MADYRHIGTLTLCGVNPSIQTHDLANLSICRCSMSPTKWVQSTLDCTPNNGHYEFFFQTLF